MIVWLANKLVSQFEKEKIISYELIEHYVYAIITMIERILTITTIVGISFFLNELVSTIIFLLIFFSLRRHTGGYHAKEFWQCYLGTIVTYILALFLSIIMTKHMMMLHVCLVNAVIYIYKIGTINHPNIAMKPNELTESKKAARRMVTFQLLLILIIDAMNGNEMYICIMSMAIILCASLMFIAKMIKQEVYYDETS